MMHWQLCFQTFLDMVYAFIVRRYFGTVSFFLRKMNVPWHIDRCALGQPITGSAVKQLVLSVGILDAGRMAGQIEDP